MTVTAAGTGSTTVNYGYTWDNANRLTGITQGSLSVGLNYDSANRRATLTLPNGVTVTYAYDADSRITQLLYGAGGSGSSDLGTLTYAYDADGRRTAVDGTLAAANLPALVAGGASTAYNADNEQTAFNGATLSYDLDGNLTGDGTNTYAWDARNHLSAISGAASASFVYDAFGRRMSKTIAGNTTQFLYDGFNPAQELSGGSSPSVNANLLTGLAVDEYFARTDASGTSALLADALGSTIGLVNSSIGPDTTARPSKDSSRRTRSVSQAATQISTGTFGRIRQAGSTQKAYGEPVRLYPQVVRPGLGFWDLGEAQAPEEACSGAGLKESM
jgi:YD repeat-containing protein